jgi:hypothetical protein
MMKVFLRQNYIWIIFLLVLSMAALAGELINNRFTMSDLEVYHKTAERLLQGEELYRSVEEDPYEHYVYKYSPPCALFFIPFVITGFSISKILYWAFLTFILGHSLVTLKDIFLNGQKTNIKIAGRFILAILIIGTHFFRELHLGQVNLVLLWLYILTLFSSKNSKPGWAGATLAISLFIKPFGLILIPFILLTGRFREVLYTLGFVIILFVIPFFFYLNIHDYLALYSSWFTELGIELGDKQDLLAVGNHTIFSVLARYSPISLVSLDGYNRTIYQLVLLVIIAAIILWYLFKNRNPEGHTRIYIVLISLIPLLAFTSYNAFIFTLPLLTYLLFHFREMKGFYRILFILSCIFIGGNIYDLVGRNMFDLFWEISVYSWGTLGLLICLFANWNLFKEN